MIKTLEFAISDRNWEFFDFRYKYSDDSTILDMLKTMYALISESQDPVYKVFIGQTYSFCRNVDFLLNRFKPDYSGPRLSVDDCELYDLELKKRIRLFTNDLILTKISDYPEFFENRSPTFQYENSYACG